MAGGGARGAGCPLADHSRFLVLRVATGMAGGAIGAESAGLGGNGAGATPLAVAGAHLGLQRRRGSLGGLAGPAGGTGAGTRAVVGGAAIGGGAAAMSAPAILGLCLWLVTVYALGGRTDGAVGLGATG